MIIDRKPGFGLLIALVFVLSACASSPSTVGKDSVVILLPLDGARFAVGEHVEIISNVSVQQWGAFHHLEVDNETYRSDRFGAEFTSGDVYLPWLPPGPGEYALRIVVETVDGNQLQSQSITIYVLASDEDVTIPTDEIADETPAPVSRVTTATAETDVYCRTGPGFGYDSAHVLRQGETVPIVGVNEEMTWGLIEISQGAGQCWVPLEYSIVVGNLSLSPIFPAPPLQATVTPIPSFTSTPSYAACHDYLDFGTCIADPMGFGGCSWDTGLGQCTP